MGVAGHLYYAQTKSLCAVCRQAVDAKVLFRDGAVYLDKACPIHGRQECLVSSSVEWYLDCLTFPLSDTPPTRAVKELSAGCPFDCGWCPSHRQRTCLPVIPITSACNLNCPVCYTINRNEGAYYLSREGMKGMIDRIVEENSGADIINFTGGEPTVHPQMIEFLEMCRDAGIRRLTVSTNGLKLVNEDYVRALGAAGARIVLSLDTVNPDKDRLLVGADTVRTKLRALDLLEKHGVPTTILPAIAAGINDDEVGPLFEMVVKRPHLRSLELHTMCFTGQGGSTFTRRARITIPDLHRRLEEATAGRITGRDFVPSPLAHPHCYSICYVLCLDGGSYVPLARIWSRKKLYELLGDSLYLEPRESLEEALREAIDDLWANPDRLPEGEAVLRTLKTVLGETFPPGKTLSAAERQEIGERRVKAIYIHSHMDEENFNVSRIMKCCVAVPEPDGSAIPTCSYNVLYRGKDPRFTGAGR